MDRNSKTVVVGLDGVPFEMLRDLANAGTMPHVQKLISRGAFKRMRSSIPEVSSVAWSSIITGRNPGEHGIFGFTDLHDQSYDMSFPNFSNLKSPPFWEDDEQTSVIVNVPSTYPVREMNGVHISGFVSIALNKSVHPASLVPALQRMDYRLDVDSQKAHDSVPSFLEDVEATLDARIEAYRYLWKYCQWRTFFLVFTVTDRLMHFLWSAYENESHEHHRRFVDCFGRIDEIIGEMAGEMTDDDLFVVLSDHGFERLDHSVNINHVLEEEGFLAYRGDQKRSVKSMCASTRAFALDPARIYLHRRGIYPDGTVSPSDVPDLMAGLKRVFSSLEVDGRRVIEHVHSKQDIYCGPYTEKAPDMVLVGSQGFNLRSSTAPGLLMKNAVYTGKHKQDNAFLLATGPSIEDIVPDSPTVFDVRRILESQAR